MQNKDKQNVTEDHALHYSQREVKAVSLIQVMQFLRFLSITVAHEEGRTITLKEREQGAKTQYNSHDPIPYRNKFHRNRK